MVFVSLQDSKGVGSDDAGDDGNDHALKGDILAILAAFGYGLYTTMIRYKVSDKIGWWVYKLLIEGRYVSCLSIGNA